MDKKKGKTFNVGEFCPRVSKANTASPAQLPGNAPSRNTSTFPMEIVLSRTNTIIRAVVEKTLQNVAKPNKGRSIAARPAQLEHSCRKQALTLKMLGLTSVGDSFGNRGESSGQPKTQARSRLLPRLCLRAVASRTHDTRYSCNETKNQNQNPESCGLAHFARVSMMALCLNAS